jgi:hypothetical protein
MSPASLGLLQHVSCNGCICPWRCPFPVDSSAHQLGSTHIAGSVTYHHTATPSLCAAAPRNSAQTMTSSQVQVQMKQLWETGTVWLGSSNGNGYFQGLRQSQPSAKHPQVLQRCLSGFVLPPVSWEELSRAHQSVLSFWITSASVTALAHCFVDLTCFLDVFPINNSNVWDWLVRQVPHRFLHGQSHLIPQGALSISPD